MSYTTFRNKVEQLLYLILLELKKFNTLFNNGFYTPITSSDASAPNNSVYFSSTTSKLTYKDAGNITHVLY